MTDDDDEHASETTGEQDGTENDEPDRRQSIGELLSRAPSISLDTATRLDSDELTCLVTCLDYADEYSEERAAAVARAVAHSDKNVTKFSGWDTEKIEGFARSVEARTAHESKEGEPQRGRFGFESTHDGASMFH